MIERAVVRGPVRADQSAAVEREHHRQVLQRHVVDQLVVGALEKSRIDRDHGLQALHGEPRGEGDRVLQAVTQVLLLNLRSTDLLCRYAGDRFAVLMPQTTEAQALALAEHLAFMVGQMRHSAQAGPVTLSIRHACGQVQAKGGDLLADLARAVDARAPAWQAVPSAA